MVFRETVREALQTVAVVCLVLMLLVVACGVWPPMVAVESGSMEPHMYKGDLIVVSAPGRYTASAANGSNIVTASEAGSYNRLGEPGDVVVYEPPMREGDPIIHRARFHVSAGENWYDKANESYLPPGVDNCEELVYCPAPYAGYVTKGDNQDTNPYYDQADGIAPIVREQWIRSKAQFRIPWLGWVRLTLAGQA